MKAWFHVNENARVELYDRGKRGCFYDMMDLDDTHSMATTHFDDVSQMDISDHTPATKRQLESSQPNIGLQPTSKVSMYNLNELTPSDSRAPFAADST